MGSCWLCVCSGGWNVGGIQGQAEHFLAVDVKTVPGMGPKREQKLANDGQAGDSGGLGARTSVNPRVFPVCYLSHYVQTQVQVLCCGQQMF